MTKLKDENLFKHNPQLEDIKFVDLNLEVINSRMFDGLKNLTRVDLRGNECINAFYDLEEVEIETVHNELDKNCMAFGEKYCERDLEDGKCECVLRSPNELINKPLDCELKALKKLSVLFYKISRFPQFYELDVQLENLTNVIVKGKLVHLHSSSLKWMKNLNELDLSYNKIEKLNSNVFDYTPALEIFKIAHNQLKMIGVMTFSHLKQLKYVDLAGNDKCTSHSVFGKEELTMLRSDKIKDSCKLRDCLQECDFVEEEFSYVGTAFTCVANNLNYTYEEGNLLEGKLQMI
jgi:hypothetical protein